VLFRSGCYELPSVGPGNGGAGGSTSSSGGSGGSGGSAGASTGGNGGSPAPLVVGCPDDIKSGDKVQPALPKENVDTAYVASKGMVYSVKAGDDLQSVIDKAVPGDGIELEVGATFTGTYTLPNKSGDAWITIRTSTPDENLPPPGTRISPTDAPKLAKLQVAGGGGPVLKFASGAHHYRLVGLEMTATPGNFVQSELVDIGHDIAAAIDLPHHIVIDRSYLHGDPTLGGRRGIALGGTHVGIVDSYFSDFKEVGVEAQAIAAWNGPGPYKIVNNHLEAAGGNVTFGAAQASLVDNIPSDIEICGNHFYKPVAWKSESWFVRDHFEILNAQRVLFAGNVLENNWSVDDSGFAMILTPRAEGGAVPGVVYDLTVTLNHIAHSQSAVALWGDDNGMSGGSKRIAFTHNLFEDINGPSNGSGRIFQLLTSVLAIDGLEINHNTAPLVGNAFLMMGDNNVVCASNFFFQNNLVAHGFYGAIGSGKSEGTEALSVYVPGATFTKNAIFGGGTASMYPMDNFFPVDANSVGFVDFTNGNFALTAESLYAKAATDGSAIGVDMTALRRAVNGVVK